MGVNREEKKYSKFSSNSTNRPLVRNFEPLLLKSMEKYQNSHNIGLQQDILAFLTLLVRFGVDYARLDKDYVFLQFVVNQVQSQNSFLPQPAVILEAIYELITSLFLYSKVIPFLLAGKKFRIIIENGHEDAGNGCGYRDTERQRRPRLLSHFKTLRVSLVQSTYL